MASSSLQSAQVSLLSRTAAQLQKQLAALQAQTLAFTSAIASNKFKQRSPNLSAAADPLMNGYHHLTAASAAERHAASIAAVAASISARTFQPAAAKVGVQHVQLVSQLPHGCTCWTRTWYQYM
jgi:hypothetical protein